MNSGLAIDLYELTMAQVYFKCKPQSDATFDVFIRSDKRPFYVACGMDDVLNYLETFTFTKQDLDYLKSLGMFDEEFLKYLEKFRFRGSIWGLEEPEIIFASEPIMRVTANIIEAQIVESIVLNKINCATTLATKSARVVLAAKGKGVYDFSLRRTQGLDAALICAKYSYITGAQGTSHVLAGYRYRIPVVGTMAHSYVMSFEREIESFLSFAKEFPTKTILLVDTYDVNRGIDSCLRIAQYLKKRGIEFAGIRLDSGDIARDAHSARIRLDKEGFIDAVIFASGNLDEYAISRLIDSKAPIDAFGVGTNMGCSSDYPYSDVIYKLVEIREKGTQFIPTMKLSEGKTTYPGRKQVYRVFDSQGKIRKDYLGLDKEHIEGKRLLRKVMDKGKRMYKEKSVQEKRKLFMDKSSTLPSYLRDIFSASKYPLEVTKGLSTLVKDVNKAIKKRISDKVIFLDIDTQVDFISKKGALYVPGTEGIIDNLKKLTAFAKKNEILIISSQDTHRRDDPEFKEFPPHCVKGTKGHKKIKETILQNYKLVPSKKAYYIEELKRFTERFPQIILEKNILNVFSNPNTFNILEAIFPDKVVVYGVVTEYCIREAVEGLLKNDFKVILVEDAIKELSLKERDRLFAAWRRKNVQFTTTDKVVDVLVAAHDNPLPALLGV